MQDSHKMDENLKEVYHNLYNSQEKYIYFIQGANIAAIGFAITRTQNLKLEITQIPLGLGVLCWGLSFLFGCLNREYYNSTLYSNGELIKIQNGIDPEIQDPRRIRAASEGITEAINKNSDKINKFGNLQSKLFILGVTLYVIWHIYEMYLNK